MPSLLLHLTAVERLAERRDPLPAPLARAFEEDLAYGRFGAALPDLPLCEGLAGSLLRLLPARPLPLFARLYHERAPVGLGLKMAELVATGALVGREPGLALLAGYFTHLCLDRALSGPVRRIVEEQRRPAERPHQARRRIEWAQTLFYLEEVEGGARAASRLRARFKLSKSAGLPLRGVGRGIYELVRVASQEVLDAAPTKRQVDGWVRGFSLSSLSMMAPLGLARRWRRRNPSAFVACYRNEAFDFRREVDGALADSVRVLQLLLAYMERRIFTPRARARFLEEVPEGPLGVCAS